MTLKKNSLFILFVFLAITYYSTTTIQGKEHNSKTPLNDSSTTNYNNIEVGLLPAIIVGDSSAAIAYSVMEAMNKYNVPGAGVTVFRDGEIVWSKHFGNKQSGIESPIDENTKFQVASIGKAVTALGILKLVDTKELDLDEDVNQYLTSYKVTGKLLKEEKVTIRQLLNHTSGAIGIGFHGYSKTAKVPSLLDIIKGKGNSPKVEFKTVPGSSFAYSGGGYAILQLLIEDYTGKSFEAFFQEEIFSPLSMNNSTFNQPEGNNIALAHDNKGKTHPEGWLVYPESSAAGLWTTSTDLAKFSIALENSYYGKENAILSKKLTHEMLTISKVWGLGIGVRGENDLSYFFHGGGNPGSYKALFTSFYKKRTGIAITTNAGKGDRLHDDLLRSFTSFFKLDVFKPKYITPFELSEEHLSDLKGKYQIEAMGEYFLKIETDESNRVVLYDPNDETRVTFVAQSETEFIDIDSGNKSSFTIDSVTGKVKTMNYSGAYLLKKVE